MVAKQNTADYIASALTFCINSLLMQWCAAAWVRPQATSALISWHFHQIWLPGGFERPEQLSRNSTSFDSAQLLTGHWLLAHKWQKNVYLRLLFKRGITGFSTLPFRIDSRSWSLGEIFLFNGGSFRSEAWNQIIKFCVESCLQIRQHNTIVL